MPPKTVVNEQFLIVGTDGLIGGALLDACHQRSLPVTGTCLEPAENQPGIRQLDLRNNLGSWSPPESCKVAILCAGITGLEACRKDPGGTWQINVLQTLQLTEILVGAGVFVVFPSSNLVFDGTLSERRADEVPCPLTQYGRQKAEVESKYAMFGDRVAIVRLTKVVPPQWRLIQGWADAMASGQTIEAFSDLVCAPIPLRLTVQGLLDIAQNQRSGIWQFSAASDVSYSDMARHIARLVGVSDKQVHPVSARGHAIEHVPRYTTLDTTRARLELGLRFPEPLRVIEEAIRCR